MPTLTKNAPARKTKRIGFAPAAKAAAKTVSKPAPAAESVAACASAVPATTPQNGSIIHVEFTTPDLAHATKFYSELFGWQIMAFKPGHLYFQTPGNWGACGCINEGPAATCAATMLYVNVANIPATLKKAGSLGATTVKAKYEIPGGHGFCAEVKMPDGNVFGLYSH